ncbi:MAG: sporulation protein YqfD [Lachnospiraceae bacterium]|nr:sporulation protein YqfD [Lachnospiraceae bacterium]
MEQHFFDFIRGYVRIRISGEACDRFLNLCAYHGIRLWGLFPADGACEAFISRKDFFRLKAFVRKSHTRVRIAGRYGFPFFIHKYRSRGACVCGAFAAAVFLFWLSAHIWNISIEGNLSQTDDVIFEYLENEGVSHGMWKNQIDTQELSEQIRMYFTQFSWVSADLKGTRLVIYVKEGTLSAAPADDTLESVGGIAAAKAGTVVSIFVRKGLAAVEAGDVVEAGDLLVSGQIPVYSDDGEVLSWQSVNADADIILRTETDYYETLAFETTLKNYTGREKRSWLLRIGDFSFALPASWESFSLFDLTAAITQVQLSENFYLPVYFYKYTAKEYESLQYSYTEEQARRILESNLSDFVENLEEKGVQIFQNNVTIDLYEKMAVAEGTLITDESAVISVDEPQR